MAKVHKTLRLDEELASRAKVAQRQGETDTATLARLIETGLDFLESEEKDREGTDALVSALQANINDLREQVAVKDKQIETLQGITQAAQALHGASEVVHVKSLEDGSNQPGRWARAWAALTGKDREERG